MKLGLTLAKTIVLLGIASWITLIAFNNITDPGTNTGLIGNMITMEAIKQDPAVGNGLEWRAWPRSLATPILVAVIVLQVGIALLLWRAAFKFLRDLFRGEEQLSSPTLRAANVGLAAFASLWFFFLVGGLWFGYWMKMGPVQGVHFTLLIVSMLTILLVNYQPRLPSSATSVSSSSEVSEQEPVAAQSIQSSSN